MSIIFLGTSWKLYHKGTPLHIRHGMMRVQLMQQTFIYTFYMIQRSHKVLCIGMTFHNVNRVAGWDGMQVHDMSSNDDVNTQHPSDKRLLLQVDAVLPYCMLWDIYAPTHTHNTHSNRTHTHIPTHKSTHTYKNAPTHPEGKMWNELIKHLFTTAVMHFDQCE